MERGQTMALSTDGAAAVAAQPHGLVDSPEERTRWRRAVLHLGARFGWSQEAVVLFAEALCSRRWEELDVGDLLGVVEEYQAMLQVLVAKLARRRCRAAAAQQQTEVADGCDE
jgi:hypothetical protein